MKNLLNLGKALEKAEQKLIQGGLRGFVNAFQCHDDNSFLNPPCQEASDCSNGFYCHIGCSQCWPI